MSKPGAGGKKKGKRFDHSKKFGVKKKRSQIEDEEIQALEARLNELMSTDLEAFAKQVSKFDDFPLSSKTKKGLEDAKYTEPTEIQRSAILPGLLGCDVLAGAKTGSGKTLAFLIPILEKLYKEKWSRRDGLGALIISPTRELALQTFKVLKVVGKHHDLSADLVIGGKFLREERHHINQTNIVICTPGRLKQHLETTFNFRADNLQILVLDEADRILDLGFQQQMTEIAENLPQDRQTLLFSATQTRVVRDLARVSMRGKPVLVFTNDLRGQSTPTPVSLRQNYIICNLSEKIDILWSFVRNYLKSKLIIFLATCKQVRFVHEIFRRLRPGVTVLALHSKMKYLKRLSVYEEFCRKQHAVLFATDIAARGLDFPAVDWVVHADCPVDINTYIHRSGRTARCQQDGASLLILLPSEEQEMVKLLKEKNIAVKKIKVDQSKRVSIQKKTGSLCASDVTLKSFAQRAFVAYLKFVVMASNKKVFDVTALDLDNFAYSLGLAFPPTVKFVTKRKEQMALKAVGKQVDKNDAKPISSSSSSDDDDGDNDDDEEEEDDEEDSDSSSNNMSSQSNKHPQLEKAQDAAKLTMDDADEKDDDFLFKKKVSTVDDELPDMPDIVPAPLEKNTSKTKKKDSKYAVAKKILKKQLQVNTKVVFDDEGLPVEDKYRQLHTSTSSELDTATGGGGINIVKAKQQMQEEDKFDKQLYREKIQQKHREKRLKLKEAKRKRKQNDDEEQDIEEETSGDDTALDFLPDPDKIYGPANDSDDDEKQESQSGSSNEDDSSDSDEPRVHRPDSEPRKKKRKLADKKQKPPAESRPRTNSRTVVLKSAAEGSNSDELSDSENDVDTGLSLMDDEAIALKLLHS